jgi:hypothetical protein
MELKMTERLQAFETLSLALALGWLISLTYAKAYRGVLLSRSFVHTILVTVPLVALAVLTIRAASTSDSPITGQALAFAFVGLLGLLRFRTVVRDTREFTFIFLALVTGAGLAGGLLLSTTIACCLLLMVLVGLEYIGFGTPAAPSLKAVVSCKDASPLSYQDALKRVATRIELISIDKTDDETEYCFEIIAREEQTLSSVMEVLNSISGTTNASVEQLQRANSK